MLLVNAESVFLARKLSSCGSLGTSTGSTRASMRVLARKALRGRRGRAGGTVGALCWELRERLAARGHADSRPAASKASQNAYHATDIPGSPPRYNTTTKPCSTNQVRKKSHGTKHRRTRELAAGTVLRGACAGGGGRGCTRRGRRLMAGTRGGVDGEPSDEVRATASGVLTPAGGRAAEQLIGAVPAPARSWGLEGARGRRICRRAEAQPFRQAG